MPHNRFYLPHDLKENSRSTIEGDEFHHMKNVMRLQVGEEFEIFNGKGLLVLARLHSFQKACALIDILQIEKEEPKPLHGFFLAIAAIKLPRLEIALEKCTEIGCLGFYLFNAEYSEKVSFSVNQKERLLHLSISACKQSGRLHLPFIEYLEDIKKLPTSYPLFFGDTSNKAPIFTEKLLNKAQVSLMVIGPEKGFHPHELKHLMSAHAQGVKLNSNILRAETAAITAASLLALYSL